MVALAKTRDLPEGVHSFVAVHKPRSPKLRSRRTARNSAAAVAATSLHLALLGLLGLSWSKTSIPLSFPADQGSIIASLTPASSLGAAAAAPPPGTSPLDMLNDSLTEAAVPVTQTRSQGDVDHLLDQMDAVTPTSQPAQKASAPARSAAKADPPVALQDPGNPWARASSTSTDPSFVQKLWMAIKPCWKGDYTQAASSIRVVLDATGHVRAMTLAGGAVERLRRPSLSRPPRRSSRARLIALAPRALFSYARRRDDQGGPLFVDCWHRGPWRRNRGRSLSAGDGCSAYRRYAWSDARFYLSRWELQPFLEWSAAGEDPRGGCINSAGGPRRRSERNGATRSIPTSGRHNACPDRH